MHTSPGDAALGHWQGVAGVLFTKGSPLQLYAARVAEESAQLVLQLERKGAIVVGKSNVPEFGAGSNC